MGVSLSLNSWNARRMSGFALRVYGQRCCGKGGEDDGSLSSHSHFVVDEYFTVPSRNGG